MSKTGPKQPQKVPKENTALTHFFQGFVRDSKTSGLLTYQGTNQRRLRRQNIKINALYISRSEQALVSVFHPRNENIKIDSVFVQGGVDPMIQGGSSNFNILLSPLKITLMTVLGHV